MTREALPLVLSAVSLVVGAAACTPRPPSGGAGPPTSGTAASSSASAPEVASAPPSTASAAPSGAPVTPTSPGACGAPCAPGTACHLTKNGPACVACAPGATPTCLDDRFVAVCGDDGALQKTTDCAARKEYCDRGRCVVRECKPNALHCFDGDVYRCNAGGSGRTLVSRCVVDGSDGSIDTPKGLCQVKNGTPACHTKCSLPDHTIVATHGCSACRWDELPFCATEGAEHSCTDWICLPGGDMGFGAVLLPCYRETDGLVVPGSDKAGACEGAGAIGARTVTYEVCRGGKPAPAKRVEPCRR